MEFPDIKITIQYFCLLSGVFLNILLISMLVFVPNKLGGFKNFLMGLAIFELTYSSISVIMLPDATVYEYQLIVFTKRRWLLETGYAAQLVGFYCALYEVWMVYIAVMFLYRYIAICRTTWYSTILRSRWIQFTLFGLYLAHLVYSGYCGVYFCTVNVLLKESQKKFDDTFFDGTHYPNSLLVFTLIDAHRQFSIGGFVAFANHLLISLFSAICVLYCGRRLAMEIKEHRNSVNVDINRQRQIFRTLLIQASTPLIFYQIPTSMAVMYIASPKFAFLGPILACCTVMYSVPKLIDPLGALIVIKEYRTPIIGFFKGVAGVPTWFFSHETSTSG